MNLKHLSQEIYYTQTFHHFLYTSKKKLLKKLMHACKVEEQGECIFLK